MMIRLEVPTRSAVRAERINAAVAHFATRHGLRPAAIKAALDAVDKPRRRRRNDMPQPGPAPKPAGLWIKEPTPAALKRAQATGAPAIAKMQAAVARARAALAEINAAEAPYP
jgi:hypothetical protein